MTEKDLRSVELTDEELGRAQGGFDICAHDGQYYLYKGNDSDLKYTCPNCGRPVHEGAAWRFYCDACDESWFFESALEPNLSSGAWKEISKEEYTRRMVLEIGM